MRKITALVGLVVAATLVVGCSEEAPEPQAKETVTVTPSPEPESPEPQTEDPAGQDAQFVTLVTDRIPGVVGADANTLVGTGRLVCSGLTQVQPMNAQNLLAFADGFYSEVSDFMSKDDVYYFIASAAVVYCPATAADMEDALGGLTGGSGV